MELRGTKIKKVKHKEDGGTVALCLLCKKPKGEYVYLSQEMCGIIPLSAVTNVYPCKACTAAFLSKGVMLVEMSKTEKMKQGEVAKELTYAVITDAAFTRLIKEPIPQIKIAFVEKGILKSLGL